MSKKGADQVDSNSNEYFKKSRPAEKIEKSSENNLGKTLRSEMLLTSSISPKKESYFQRINLKYIFGILLTIFIVVFTWFLLDGPGRPILERNLALLVHAESTPTPTMISTVSAPTATLAQQNDTPLSSPPFRPTKTPTIRTVATATREPATATSTSTPSCRDALTITLADVGQTFCVQGIIIQTVEQPNAYMVIFNTQPGSFYWVTYDLVWNKAELDSCYQTTGKIEQLGNSPILRFNYNNLPELCP